MIQTTRLIRFSINANQVLQQVKLALIDAGLNVIQSFDLHAAKATHTGCTCPNHGTEFCDCQMHILLVYGLEGQPATLIIHGHDGTTFLYIVDVPGQRPADRLVKSIYTVLVPESPDGIV